MSGVTRQLTASHHLYVHVPFCRLVCAYCDFVTVGGRGDAIPRYVAALHAELALRPAPGRLATIYFGGGTPSLLPVRAVEGLIRAAMDRWVGDPEEITLEANPSGREAPDWMRAAGRRRDAHLAGRAVAARRRSAGAGARAFGRPRCARRSGRRGRPGSTTSAWT